jgi:hypothetical protein
MGVGFVASLINGASLPIMAIFFGKMTNMFIQVAKDVSSPRLPKR